MNFWNDHGMMFIVGLILCPRMMVLYLGILPPGSISSITGFLLVPRMFIASTLSHTYGHTNSDIVVICWIIAVIFDVIGCIFRFHMMSVMWKVQMEQMHARMR